MRDIDVEMEWVWEDTRHAFVCRMFRCSRLEYKSKETPYTVTAKEIVTSCTSGPYVPVFLSPGHSHFLLPLTWIFCDLCTCKESPLLVLILLTVWLTLLYTACVAKVVHLSENSITPLHPQLLIICYCYLMPQHPEPPLSWYFITFHSTFYPAGI